MTRTNANQDRVESHMDHARRVIRNLVVGVLLAGGIGLASSQLDAFAPCRTGYHCYGETFIECGCMGDGICIDVGNGTLSCSCTGWAEVRCDCYNGCVEVPNPD